MEIAKEHGDTNQETEALLGLGIAYRMNNQIQKAIEYFEKALEIAKEHEDTNKETEHCLG